MLVVTFVCVWLGVTVQWPPVGIGLAVLAAPALARAWWYQRAWRKAGVPLTPFQAALSFVGSLVVMALVAAAGSVAFVGVCFPIGLSQFEYRGPTIEFLFYSAWFWGGVAALLVGGFIVWRLWIAAARQRRITGMPPSGRQRLLAFWHVLFIVFCVLTIGCAAGIGGMLLFALIVELLHSPGARVVARAVMYVIGLAGFAGGGWIAYRLTRNSLAGAAPWFAACLAGWLGLGIGWAISLNLPYGSDSIAAAVWALWTLPPLVLGTAGYWLYWLIAAVLGGKDKGA
jgi:hypothetical protein